MMSCECTTETPKEPSMIDNQLCILENSRVLQEKTQEILNKLAGPKPCDTEKESNIASFKDSQSRTQRYQTETMNLLNAILEYIGG